VSLTQLFSINSPVRVVYGDSDNPVPTLIVNRDIINSVVYGDRDIASLNTAAFSVIDALGSVTVDGTTDIWVAPLAGTPTIDVIPGASSWTPSPALVAAQISTLGLAKDTTLQTTNTNTASTNTSVQATTTGIQTVNSTLGTPAQRVDVQGLTVGGTPGGVPALRGTSNLGIASAQTVAGATTATLLSLVAITKPSFESIFQLNLPAAVGTVPFAVLGVGWTDSNSGLQVGFKQYILTAGNGPTNSLTFYLSGPCRGNEVTLTLQNLDPAQTMTYTYAFNMTSHTYLVDRFLQPAYPTVNPITFSTPGGNPAKGALALTQASIAGSSTINRLLACSNAKCKLLFDNSTANACNILLQDPGTLYNGGTANQNFVRLNLAAQTTNVVEFQMPNGPLNMIIQNTAAGAVSPGIAIMIMEY
jgi:hypothetical protein